MIDLSSLLPVIGQVGIDALKDEIEDLTEDANEPWKKAVLGLVGDAVVTFGPQGVSLATKALEDLMNGEGEPDLSWADLGTASDVLAHLQSVEADRKSEVSDFLTKVGKVLGQLFGGFIKGLIATV